LSNIKQNGLYFVDDNYEKSVEKFCGDTKCSSLGATNTKQGTIDKLYSRTNEKHPEAQKVSSVASLSIYSAIMIKQCDDDIDCYFNLGNLDLEDRDIYNIIESEELPAVN
jgi:hypothetical protein